MIVCSCEERSGRDVLKDSKLITSASTDRRIQFDKTRPFRSGDKFAESKAVTNRSRCSFESREMKID